MDILSPNLKKNVYDMLDWNSRLNLNLTLPPKERIGLKFKKIDIQRHEVYVMTRLIKNRLDSCQIQRAFKDKIKHFINIFKLCKDPRILHFIIQFNDLRATFIQKMNAFSDITLLTRIYPELELDDIKNLVSTSTIMKHYLQKQKKVTQLTHADGSPVYYNKMGSPICVI
jgi:hypothetical protein